MPIFKEMKWNLILTACICIAAGLILIFFPEITAKTPVSYTHLTLPTIGG